MITLINSEYLEGFFVIGYSFSLEAMSADDAEGIPNYPLELIVSFSLITLLGLVKTIKKKKLGVGGKEYCKD